MSFIKTLIDKLGSFFESLFSAAAKAWNKLSPEIQQAMIHGSGVLEVINSNASKPVGLIISSILDKYTDLNKDKLLAGLQKVAQGLNIAEGLNDADLETVVQKVANYLNEQEGGVWAGVSSLAAKLFALATAPAGTKWDVFESLMVYVYHEFVKKD